MDFVWEHNGKDTLLYSTEYIGAYTRGENLEIAAGKMKAEILAYCRWANLNTPEDFKINIIQEKVSDLQIFDADSDVIFDCEKAPLSIEEYHALKHLVLKSAVDFHTLYASISDKHRTCLPLRRTFYGNVPRTAQEMYDHTKNVNAYYFAEIGASADNEGTIYECRKRAFDLLEEAMDVTNNPVITGSYNELWSVRKMLRRFLWHDRIHAKAMYRMAIKVFGSEQIEDIFHFEV